MTQKSKPTPGPWELNWQQGYGINKGAKHIALVSFYRSEPKDKDENEANARLIAAAPLMAEALKNLVKADEAYNRDNDLNDDWEPLNLAREALKAAGLNDENEGE